MTDFGKAAREKARQRCEFILRNAPASGGGHTMEMAALARVLLDALDAADSDNTRLQARVTELEAALAKSENILARNLGHQTEKCYDALEIIRDALFPGLRLPAPPVGDR